MQQITQDKTEYLIGNSDILEGMKKQPSRSPFDEVIVDFCSEVSRILMEDEDSRSFPDVVTFAFWLRKTSVISLKKRFQKADNGIVIGRGTVFHIAPSNVAVNFAYSLFSGILTGNANIVRIPSKDFPQTEMIIRAIKKALDRSEDMRPYICLVRYGHEKDVNDLLSSMCDVRIIWGGDATISGIRESKLSARASEITFADRYSLAVLDSDEYLDNCDKEKTARDFYNDTFYSDQNACTSPMLVVWLGERSDPAKKIFWEKLHDLAASKYRFQTIQGIDKLVLACSYAVNDEKAVINTGGDNLIYRIGIDRITDEIIDRRGNSGLFYEYDCDDIMELRELCDDRRVQTVGYIGDAGMFEPLFDSGIHGIDRIVPVGKTMDFDLIWDGYDLYERLTRQIAVMK